MSIVWNGPSCGVLLSVLLSGVAATGRSDPQPDALTVPKPTKISAQDFQRLIEAENGRLQNRERRIDAELAALDRTALADGDWAKEWAGTYYTGDGLGMNVTIKIAPKAGITFTWHGCMGLYDANHGDIAGAFEGGISVRLAIDVKASTFAYMSEKLYFVRWGARRYLVPESRMLELVNNYNDGGFARDGMYSIPLRFDGQVTRQRCPEPPGRPQLPPQYAKLIIEKPLRITISKVTPHPNREVTDGVEVTDCTVEIVGGQDQGVFVGMEIPFERHLTFGKIRIDRVDAAISHGTLSLFGRRNEPPQLPIPGTELNFPGAKADEVQKPDAASEKAD